MQRRTASRQAQLAAAARLRSLLRHDSRRREVSSIPSSLTRDNTPISPFADPEYKPEDVLLHRRDQRSRGAVSSASTRATCDAAVLHVRRLSPPRTGRCTPCRKTSPSTRANTTRATSRFARRFEKRSEVRPDRCRAGDWRRTGEVGRGRRQDAGKRACMEVYAAMIDRMDQGIGRIVARAEASNSSSTTRSSSSCRTTAVADEAMGRSGNKQHPNIEPPASPTLP